MLEQALNELRFMNIGRQVPEQTEAYRRGYEEAVERLSRIVSRMLYNPGDRYIGWILHALDYSLRREQDETRPRVRFKDVARVCTWFAASKTEHELHVKGHLLKSLPLTEGGWSYREIKRLYRKMCSSGARFQLQRDRSVSTSNQSQQD